MSDPQLEAALRRIEALEEYAAAGAQGGWEAWRAFFQGKTKLDGLGLQLQTGDASNNPAITWAGRFFGPTEDLTNETYGRIEGRPSSSELVFIHHTSAGSVTMTLGIAGLALDRALSLVQASADQASAADGWILYRNDLEQFRGYRNGEWLNFLMDGDAFGQSLSTGMSWQDDFLNYPLSGRWVEAITGAGALVDASVGTPEHPGIIQLATGTDTTGVVAIHTATNPIALGGGEFRFDAIVYLEDLSVLAQRYKVFVGLRTAATAADSVRFTYTDTEESGEWVIETIEDTVSSTDNSGITVAADTWYKLSFVVNAAATSVEFFIDDASVGTLATNVPDTNDPMGLRLVIQKSLGTTSRVMFVDAVEINYALTTPR